ncbi:MAG TPA: hypothetical protein VIC82_05730 [Candidatus Nanopelagicales bacterium]
MAQQRGPRSPKDGAPAGRDLPGPAAREPSRLGVDAARRARDVSRPDARDLERAETSVVVRRARPVT